MYYQYYFPDAAVFWCSVVVAIIIGAIAYKIADKSFESKNYDEVLEHVKTVISIKKKLVKGHDFDQDDLDARIVQIKNELSDNKKTTKD